MFPVLAFAFCLLAASAQDAPVLPPPPPRPAFAAGERRGLQQQGADSAAPPGTDDGGEATPAPPPPPKTNLKPLSVVYERDDFARQGAYPYKECLKQPGEIGGSETGSADKRAQCVPVEAGELSFCNNVAYDACMRVPSPSEYDITVEAAYTLRLTYANNEEPQTPGCLAAFKSFLCASAFPMCLEYAEIHGRSAEIERYYEIPLCWDFCLSSEMACLADGNAAALACQKLVDTGRVAPDRGGIKCQGGAGGHYVALVAFAAMAWALLL